MYLFPHTPQEVENDVVLSQIYENVGSLIFSYFSHLL